MKLFISPGGTVRAIYSDNLPTGLRFGRLTVDRASHVEFDNARGGWTVTFPDGSALPTVYSRRADALAAEVVEVEQRLRSGRSGNSS